MLIVLPLGLFVGAVVFDGMYLWNRSSTLATVGYWNIAGGIAGGLLAAVFGFIDWWNIPNGTRAKRIGLWHGGSNVAAIIGFLFVCLWRDSQRQLATTPPLFTGGILPLILWLGRGS